MKFPFMLQRRNVVPGAAILVTVFFFVYSFLPLAAPWRYNSPDESANAFFAKLFATETKLWNFDGVNIIIDGLVHPRSVRVVDNFQVPGGFLGLPVIYGTLLKAFGERALPFLTPLFAVIAAGLLGLIVRRFTNARTGLLATALLLVQPAWWYESSRSLYPNILFMSLLIISAWFFLAAPVSAIFKEKKRRFAWLGLSDNSMAGVAGVFFGLALAVRPSEAYWTLPVAVVLAIINWRTVAKIKLAIFFGSATLSLLPFLWLNQVVYGSWLATGYGDVAAGLPVAARPVGGGARLLGALGPWLFPLGFAPRVALQNFWTYGLVFFVWWTCLTVIATVVGVRTWFQSRRPTKVATQFFLVGGAVALWLIMFYGSYRLQDNPDPTAVTIGSSYLRYWLPLFVMSVVPLAWLLDRLIEIVAARARLLVGIVLVSAIATLGGLTVFFAPQEGLLALREKLFRYDYEVKRVLQMTEPSALIVTDRADKLLFPERRVITPLRADTTYEALGKMAGTNLYYYGITLPEQDVRWLNEVKLPPLNLRIEPLQSFAEETLYALRQLAPVKRP